MIEWILSNPAGPSFALWISALVIAYFRKPVPVLGEYGVSGILTVAGSFLYLFAVPNPVTGWENVITIIAKAVLLGPLLILVNEYLEVKA
jgi:hypothetical protein